MLVAIGVIFGLAAVVLSALMGGCVTTGEFSGTIKNPEGELVYVCDGKTESHTSPDIPVMEAFSIFGLSITEIIGLLTGAGILGAGGVLTTKKLGKKRKNGNGNDGNKS